MVGDVEDHAKLAKKFPDRVILYGYVNPLDGKKALEQMEYQVNTLGAKAFKLYPIDPRERPPDGSVATQNMRIPSLRRRPS